MDPHIQMAHYSVPLQCTSPHERFLKWELRQGAQGELLRSWGPRANRRERESSCVRLLMPSTCQKNRPACSLTLICLDMVYNLIPLQSWLPIQEAISWGDGGRSIPQCCCGHPRWIVKLWCSTIKYQIPIDSVHWKNHNKNAIWTLEGILSQENRLQFPLRSCILLCRLSQ